MTQSVIGRKIKRGREEELPNLCRLNKLSACCPIVVGILVHWENPLLQHSFLYYSSKIFTNLSVLYCIPHPSFSFPLPHSWARTPRILRARGGLLHKVRTLLQWDLEARGGVITLTPCVPRYALPTRHIRYSCHSLKYYSL